MSFEQNKLIAKLTSPAGTLGIGLLLAIVLALLPGRWTGSLRGLVATMLRPGQEAALGLRRQGHRAITRIRSHLQTAARLVETESRLERLEQQNRRLAAELAAAGSQPAGLAGGTEDQARCLLRARGVPARVLGRQARTFLGRHPMLDVGSDAGIEPDALVVDAPALIDQGRDADIRAGQLVLDGRCVWGKIVQLGRRTSTVCAVTEPGYRDVVRLGDASGPQGILEGTGRPLARIRLVGVTEPVSVGDPVCTAAYQGVLADPLLYGHVVRLERPVGAAYWEIWMQPAVADEPDRVAVLRVELNPLRVAGRRPAF